MSEAILSAWSCSRRLLHQRPYRNFTTNLFFRAFVCSTKGYNFKRSWVVEKGNLNCIFLRNRIFVTAPLSFDLPFKHFIEFGECAVNHSSAIVLWIKRGTP